jgi:hypothetical protein
VEQELELEVASMENEVTSLEVRILLLYSLLLYSLLLYSLLLYSPQAITRGVFLSVLKSEYEHLIDSGVLPHKGTVYTHYAHYTLYSPYCTHHAVLTTHCTLCPLYSMLPHKDRSATLLLTSTSVARDNLRTPLHDWAVLTNSRKTSVERYFPSCFTWLEVDRNMI